MNEKTKVDAPQRSCETCAFSELVPAIGPDGAPLIGQSTLVCMRRPPQCVMVTVRTPMGEQHGLRTQFPPVGAEMYCFDYWPADQPYPMPDESENDADFDMITGKKMN